MAKYRKRYGKRRGSFKKRKRRGRRITSYGNSRGGIRL